MKTATISALTKDFRKAFPKRTRNAHKGQFGRMFFLCGSEGLTGAAVLATIGALRSGAGLVSLGTPSGCADRIVKSVPEVMTRPLSQTRKGSVSFKALSAIRKSLKNQDVLAVGPGLSQDKSTQQLIRKLVGEVEIPIVLDADGLNAFKGVAENLKRAKAPLVLTPHPGEFTGLFGQGKLKTDRERASCARSIAEEFGITLVLKGAGTVIASSGGKVTVNPTGNPGLATGGSGDVLCGIVASFLGQGLDSYEASRLAVFVHGYAADLAAKKLGEVSLIPTDLVDYLPSAFQKLLGW